MSPKSPHWLFLIYAWCSEKKDIWLVWVLFEKNKRGRKKEGDSIPPTHPHWCDDAIIHFCLLLHHIRPFKCAKPICHNKENIYIIWFWTKVRKKLSLIVLENQRNFFYGGTNNLFNLFDWWCDWLALGQTDQVKCI